MSFIDSEKFLTVPSELVTFNKGFGVDIGSSGAKFVYFTKEDKEQADLNNSGTAKIRTITLQRGELLEGLNFIKQRAYLFTEKTDEQSPEDVFFTGIGCTQLEKTIAGILNTRFKVIPEMDSAAAAFHYMTRKLGRRHLLEPRNEQAVTDAVNYAAAFAGAIATMKNSGQTSGAENFEEENFYTALQHHTGHAVTSATAATVDDDDAAGNNTLLEAESDLYPFLLIGWGSFVFSLKCEAPNEFAYGDLSTYGGRTMLGLANKLVGCKTYRELIDLASKGDSSKVHETNGEAFQSEDKSDNDNVYKALENCSSGVMKETLYSFGKLVGADCAEFRDEDIASALVELFVQEFVKTVQLFSFVSGIKRVFLCGGLFSHAYVRQLVAKEMVKKNLLNFMTAQAQPVVFDIVKFPQELTAFGCMVFDYQQKQQKESAS